jgi:hypothetical protein
MYSINQITKFLCGDFALFQEVQNPKWVSQVIRGKINTRTLHLWPALHEFCHFIEASGEKLFLPDFGLMVTETSDLLREDNTFRICEKLVSYLRTFPEFEELQSFTYRTKTDYSKYQTADTKVWRPEIEEILDKLHQNIRLIKFF